MSLWASLRASEVEQGGDSSRSRRQNNIELVMLRAPGWLCVFAEHAVDGGAGDTIALGQLTQTLALLAIPPDSSTIEFEGLAPDVAALELCSAHAGAHPLDDQVALEFRDRTDDDHDRPAQGAAGVDLFAEAEELDVEPVQLIKYLEEVLHGPGNTIRSPDQDGLEAAAAGIAHHGIKTRPPGFGAADRVGILLDDLVAALLSHLAEVVELSLGVLVQGRHTHVQCGALHKRDKSSISHISEICKG